MHWQNWCMTGSRYGFFSWHSCRWISTFLEIGCSIYCVAELWFALDSQRRWEERMRLRWLGGLKCQCRRLLQHFGWGLIHSRLVLCLRLRFVANQRSMLVSACVLARSHTKTGRRGAAAQCGKSSATFLREPLFLWLHWAYAVLHNWLRRISRLWSSKKLTKKPRELCKTITLRLGLWQSFLRLKSSPNLWLGERMRGTKLQGLRQHSLCIILRSLFSLWAEDMRRAFLSHAKLGHCCPKPFL